MAARHSTDLTGDTALDVLLGRPAPSCAWCVQDEHEDCVSAGETGAVDLCGCTCHLW